MLSTKDSNEVYRIPKLKNCKQSERFQNCSNSLKENLYYDFIPNFTEQVDVLAYLKDPLI